jgi:hypothetical protein
MKTIGAQINQFVVWKLYDTMRYVHNELMVELIR